MNNDLPPSWKFEIVVTINCEFNLFGLSNNIIYQSVVALTTNQVLFQLQSKGTVMVVIELYFGSIDTAKWWLCLTKIGLYLLMMWLFQPMLCYFNQV